MLRPRPRIKSKMNTPKRDMMLGINGDISPGTEDWFLQQYSELLPISPSTSRILETLGNSPGVSADNISHSLLDETPLPISSVSKNVNISAVPTLDENPGLDMSACVSGRGIKPIPRMKERLFEKKYIFYFRPNGRRRQFLLKLPSCEKLRIYKDDAVRLGYIEGPRTDGNPEMK